MIQRSLGLTVMIALAMGAAAGCDEPGGGAAPPRTLRPLEAREARAVAPPSRSPFEIPARPAAPAPESAPGEGVSAMSVGDTGAAKYFTDVVLINHEGKKLRLYSDLIKGKVVIINVFFSTCAGSCPMMARTFGKIQEHVGDRLGKDVVMLSISVDPAKDTTEKLADYAARQKAGPGWHFLTGPKASVELVLKKLGYFVNDPRDHSPVVILGNEPTGLWKKALGLANPDELIAVVDSVLFDRSASPGVR